LNKRFGLSSFVWLVTAQSVMSKFYFIFFLKKSPKAKPVRDLISEFAHGLKGEKKDFKKESKTKGEIFLGKISRRTSNGYLLAVFFMSEPKNSEAIPTTFSFPPLLTCCSLSPIS
jgi:hypothetical protein